MLLSIAAFITVVVDTCGLSGAATVRNMRLSSCRNPNEAILAREVLEVAIKAVRDRALNSNKVDWSSVEPRVRTLAHDAATSSDVYPAIRALLAELQDHHSTLLEPTAREEMLSNGRPSEPVQVTVSNKVGYILMPSFSGVDLKATVRFSDETEMKISRFAKNAACGWIVDLRRDGGGNMWPMLSALRPFFGNEIIGSFRRAGSPDYVWRFDDPPKTSEQNLEHTPVAVLLDSETASSGEAVAIAFIGRPRTKSFGVPTLGLTTANSVVDLPDGSRIMLAVSEEADRTGRIHNGPLVPDVPVAPSRSAPNAVRQAAEDWLREEAECTTSGN